MSLTSETYDPRMARGKSRVTNGHRSFVGEKDERGPLARRWRDVLKALVSDAGGEDRVSTARMCLIRKASTIIVRLEVMEARLIVGGDAAATLDDLEIYARVSSQLRRLLETLGLDRVQLDVTPTLDAVVAKHRSARKAEGEQKPAAAATVAATPLPATSEPRCEPAEGNKPVSGAISTVTGAEASHQVAEPVNSPALAQENTAPADAEIAA